MNNSYEKIMFNNQVSTAVTNYLLLQQRFQNIGQQYIKYCIKDLEEIAKLAESEIQRLADTREQANCHDLPKGYDNIMMSLDALKNECEKCILKVVNEKEM